MKNTYQKIAALFLVALSAASCSDSSQQKMENKADTLAAKVENTVGQVKDNIEEQRDENFVKDVIHGNAQELHLLTLAEKKGTAKDVRDAAKKMQPDHEKLGRTFLDYATAKGLPAAPDSSDMEDRMDNDKKGTDWDKDWVKRMADDHQSLIDKFENRNIDDPELKKMVADALPVLRSHLDMLRAIQDKMK